MGGTTSSTANVTPTVTPAPVDLYNRYINKRVKLQGQNFPNMFMSYDSPKNLASVLLTNSASNKVLTLNVIPGVTGITNTVSFEISPTPGLSGNTLYLYSDTSVADYKLKLTTSRSLAGVYDIMTGNSCGTITSDCISLRVNGRNKYVRHAGYVYYAADLNADTAFPADSTFLVTILPTTVASSSSSAVRQLASSSSSAARQLSLLTNTTVAPNRFMVDPATPAQSHFTNNKEVFVVRLGADKNRTDDIQTVIDTKFAGKGYRVATLEQVREYVAKNGDGIGAGFIYNVEFELDPTVTNKYVVVAALRYGTSRPDRWGSIALYTNTGASNGGVIVDKTVAVSGFAYVYGVKPATGTADHYGFVNDYKWSYYGQPYDVEPYVVYTVSDTDIPIPQNNVDGRNATFNAIAAGYGATWGTDVTLGLVKALGGNWTRDAYIANGWTTFIPIKMTANVPVPGAGTTTFTEIPHTSLLNIKAMVIIGKKPEYGDHIRIIELNGVKYTFAAEFYDKAGRIWKKGGTAMSALSSVVVGNYIPVDTTGNSTLSNDYVVSFVGSASRTKNEALDFITTIADESGATGKYRMATISQLRKYMGPPPNKKIGMDYCEFGYIINDDPENTAADTQIISAFTISVDKGFSWCGNLPLDPAVTAGMFRDPAGGTDYIRRSAFFVYGPKLTTGAKRATSTYTFRPYNTYMNIVNRGDPEPTNYEAFIVRRVDGAAINGNPVSNVASTGNNVATEYGVNRALRSVLDLGGKTAKWNFTSWPVFRPTESFKRIAPANGTSLTEESTAITFDANQNITNGVTAQGFLLYGKKPAFADRIKTVGGVQYIAEYFNTDTNFWSMYDTTPTSVASSSSSAVKQLASSSSSAAQQLASSSSSAVKQLASSSSSMVASTVSAPVELYNRYINKSLKLQGQNFPNMFMSYDSAINLATVLLTNSISNKVLTLNVVPGVTGIANTVSFEIRQPELASNTLYLYSDTSVADYKLKLTPTRTLAGVYDIMTGNSCGAVTSDCISLRINGTNKYVRHAGYVYYGTDFGADGALPVDSTFIVTILPAITNSSLELYNLYLNSVIKLEASTRSGYFVSSGYSSSRNTFSMFLGISSTMDAIVGNNPASISYLKILPGGAQNTVVIRIDGGSSQYLTRDGTGKLVFDSTPTTFEIVQGNSCTTQNTNCISFKIANTNRYIRYNTDTQLYEHTLATDANVAPTSTFYATIISGGGTRSAPVELYNRYINKSLKLQGQNFPNMFMSYESTANLAAVLLRNSTDNKVLTLNVVPGVTGIANTVSFEIRQPELSPNILYLYSDTSVADYKLKLTPSRLLAGVYDIMTGNSCGAVTSDCISLRINGTNKYVRHAGYVYIGSDFGVDGALPTDSTFLVTILPTTMGSSSSSAAQQLASSSSSAARQLASSSSSGGLPGIGSSSSSFKAFASSSSSFAPFASSSSSLAPVIASSSSSAARQLASSSSSAARQLASSSSSAASVVLERLQSAYTNNEIYILSAAAANTTNLFGLITDIFSQLPVGTRFPTYAEFSSMKLPNNNLSNIISSSSGIPIIITGISSPSVNNVNTVSGYNYDSTTPKNTLSDYKITNYSTNLTINGSGDSKTIKFVYFVLYGPKPSLNQTIYSTLKFNINAGLSSTTNTIKIKNPSLNNAFLGINVAIYDETTFVYSINDIPVGSSSSSARRFASSSSSARRFASSSSAAAPFGSSSSSALKQFASSSFSAIQFASSSSSSSISNIPQIQYADYRIQLDIAVKTANYDRTSTSAKGIINYINSNLKTLDNKTYIVINNKHVEVVKYNAEWSNIYKKSLDSLINYGSFGLHTDGAVYNNGWDNAPEQFLDQLDKLMGLQLTNFVNTRPTVPFGSSSSAAQQLASSSSSVATTQKQLASSSSSAVPITRRPIYNTSNPSYNELYLVNTSTIVSQSYQPFIDFILAYFPIGTRIATVTEANTEINKKALVPDPGYTNFIAMDGSTVKFYASVSDLNTNTSIPLPATSTAIKMLLYGPKPTHGGINSTGATNSFSQTYNGIIYKTWSIMNRPGYYSALDVPTSIGSSSSSAAQQLASSSSSAAQQLASSSSSAARQLASSSSSAARQLASSSSSAARQLASSSSSAVATQKQLASSSSSAAPFGSSSSSAAKQLASSSSSAVAMQKQLASSSSSAAPIFGSSSSSAVKQLVSSSSSAAPFASSSSLITTVFGSSSSERKQIASSSYLPPLEQPQTFASSSSFTAGIPGVSEPSRPPAQPASAPAPAPSPTPTISTGRISRLTSQLFPVSYADNRPIRFSNILEILYALRGTDNASVRLATVEDLMIATKFGLNWCFPSYVQKSTQDTSLVIYAASQPGKCGTKSQRQLIKVSVPDSYTLDPTYVFVFGPKPDQSFSAGKIITPSGHGLYIHNFYDPITGISGFRNRREPFATTPTTCYNATDCVNTTVQAAITEAATGTSTLADPISIVPSNISTGSGSSGSNLSTQAPALDIPITLTGQPTTPLPVTELVTIPESSVQTYNSYYTTPSQASSSAAAAAAKRPTSTYTGPSPTSTDTPTTKPNVQYNYTIVQNKLAQAKQEAQQATEEAKQAQVIQYVESTAPPVAEEEDKAPIFTYDPNANFFVNLLSEFQSDATRVLKGVQAATR